MEFKFSISELSDRIENFKKQKIYRWNSTESLNPFERFLGQCLAFVTFALIAIFIILSGLFLLGIFVLLCLAVIAFAVFIIISIVTIATIILGIIVNIIIAAKGTLLIMALEMKSNYTKFDLIKNSQDATKWESITVIKSEKERIMWIWCIIIAYTIPELINSLLCFKKRQNMPTVNQFLLVMIPETLYVIGVALIVFAILPQSNFHFIIFFVWCIIECGLHNLISTFYEVDNKKLRHLLIVINIIFLSIFINYAVIHPLDGITTNFNNILVTMLALILLHGGFWQDVSGSVLSLTGNIVTLNKARMKLKPAKNFIFALISIWKVIVFFVSSLLILSCNGDNIGHILTEFGSSFSEHTVSFIVNKIETNQVIQSITFPILILSIQIIFSTYATFKGHDVEFSRFLLGFDFRSFWGFNIPIFFLYFMKLILELILPDKNYLNIDINGQIILNDDLFEAINQKSSSEVEPDLLYPFRNWKSTALMIPCAWIFIHFVLRIYFRFNQKINKDFDDDVELDTRPLID